SHSFFCADTLPWEHFAMDAMVRNETPASSSDSIRAEFLFRTRPILAPRALAAASPLRTLSAIKSLSSCAMAEMITKTTWPKLVLRSSFSDNDTKFVLFARIISSPLSIWVTERAYREKPLLAAVLIAIDWKKPSGAHT